jgi:hypothetical protein
MLAPARMTRNAMGRILSSPGALGVNVSLIAALVASSVVASSEVPRRL